MDQNKELKDRVSENSKHVINNQLDSSISLAGGVIKKTSKYPMYAFFILIFLSWMFPNPVFIGLTIVAFILFVSTGSLHVITSLLIKTGIMKKVLSPKDSFVKVHANNYVDNKFVENDINETLTSKSRNSNVVEELEKLKHMRDSGDISNEEFSEFKVNYLRGK